MEQEAREESAKSRALTRELEWIRSSPKARGRWGERALQNVLEQCGLAEHTDFVTEHSIDTEDGRLRPDAIVRVPGNTRINRADKALYQAKASGRNYPLIPEANTRPSTTYLARVAPDPEDPT